MKCSASPHDRGARQRALERRQRHTGGDAHDDRVVAQVRRDRGQQVIDHLRLDPDDHDARGRDRLRVAVRLVLQRDLTLTRRARPAPRQQYVTERRTRKQMYCSFCSIVQEIG